MKKKLVIRFVKFEYTLVMQILGQKGTFNDSEHVKLRTFPLLELDSVYLRGCENELDFAVSAKHFDSNIERDKCLERVITWISEEQFATDGKLEIGKMCEVSSNGRSWGKSELLAVLPEKYKRRYIVSSFICADAANDWEYARPIVSCVQPKIDGDIYTWEREVENEK